jgi:hypothetical protein
MTIKELQMRTPLVICSLLLIGGVVSGAALSRSTGANDVHRPVARVVGDVATPAPASAAESAGNPLQLDPGAPAACGEGTTSDAASCGTGGWVFDPDLGCCFNIPFGYHGKWRLGSQVKCCGACAGL